jgi:hypothetical protein
VHEDESDIEYPPMDAVWVALAMMLVAVVIAVLRIGIY